MGTGEELHTARIESGLTYRQAAARLGIALSTLQRWERADSVDDSAIAKLRDGDVPGGPEASNQACYQIGRAMAVLEAIAGELPDIVKVGPGKLGGRLGQAVRLAHDSDHALGLAAHEAILTEIMRHIPADPPDIAAGYDLTAYWLGYYHQKADLRPDDGSNDEPEA